jgi:hypothetical protein
MSARSGGSGPNCQGDVKSYLSSEMDFSVGKFFFRLLFYSVYFLVWKRKIAVWHECKRLSLKIQSHKGKDRYTNL